MSNFFFKNNGPFRIDKLLSLSKVINKDNLSKVKKYFSKEYQPYIIGKITSGKGKILFNEKINWS